MPLFPLSQKRFDRILFLVYLVLVPLMIAAVLVIVLVQTSNTRDEAKAIAEQAKVLAHQTCVHTNRRDRIMRRVLNLSISLTKSLDSSLTPAQLDDLDRIRQLSLLLRPQSCAPV